MYVKTCMLLLTFCFSPVLNANIVEKQYVLIVREINQSTYFWRD